MREAGHGPRFLQTAARKEFAEHIMPMRYTQELGHTFLQLPADIRLCSVLQLRHSHRLRNQKNPIINCTSYETLPVLHFLEERLLVGLPVLLGEQTEQFQPHMLFVLELSAYQQDLCAFVLRLDSELTRWFLRLFVGLHNLELELLCFVIGLGSQEQLHVLFLDLQSLDVVLPKQSLVLQDQVFDDHLAFLVLLVVAQTLEQIVLRLENLL